MTTEQIIYELKSLADTSGEILRVEEVQACREAAKLVGKCEKYKSALSSIRQKCFVPLEQNANGNSVPSAKYGLFAFEIAKIIERVFDCEDA